MASGPVVGTDDGTREKRRYTESKVYTRKAFKGPKKDSLNNPNTTTTGGNTNTETCTNTNTNTLSTIVTDPSKCDHNKDNTNNQENEKSSPQVPSHVVVSDNANSNLQPSAPHVEVGSNGFSPNRQQEQSVVVTNQEPPPVNAAMVNMDHDNKFKINFASLTKQEVRVLRRRLQGELELVRNWVKKFEEKETQISGLSNTRPVVNDVVDNGVRRVHSEVGSVGVTTRESRPLNQLSLSVLENSHGITDSAEKEKRTPKANQFYRNSEFLLAKDKIPPAESNKKSKANGKKKGGGVGPGFGIPPKFVKSCGSLLEKLMKHQYGWVFNKPVDVKGLGLHDYYSIIKQPMDLGTVKTRLNKNWYKSPREFAEDVRLTFHNAMTYNPKGQDVHTMAEVLLKIFEDRWTIIESEYNREMRFGMEYEMGLPTPPSRKAPPFLPPPLDMRRVLDRSESLTYSTDSRPRLMSVTPSGRTPAPKKPKAKDPHKRDMTYDEKQKLSTNLQNLPSDKLDNIVQIIKKRNTSLFQHDDEIEVDIDSVDTETLWELDRFVTNYKKSLSKNKRKAELAMQAREEAQRRAADKEITTVVVEAPQETNRGEQIVPSSLPAETENQPANSSHSTSSNSSSSDSGSSSSDSDSDSSSASESDMGHSPRT